MMIQLTADDEQLIQQRIQSGLFQSAEEVIHDALAAQGAETDWLARNKDALNAKIAGGIYELDRGEGVSGDEARAWLQNRKADWLRGNKR